MLPFTKRPGRDESEDHDVVTKDDVETSETNPKAKGSAPVTGPRAKFASLSDEEMTNIMPSKSIGDALDGARSSPRPAAGSPASPSSRAPRAMPSSRPASASRSGKFAAIDDEEADGRTSVRGAPKIVKRASGPSKSGSSLQPPTTVSPAAVIKATLESSRVGRKTNEHLMAPPPQDLLEDLADLQDSFRPNPNPGSENTKILGPGGSSPPGPHNNFHSQGMALGSLPPSSVRPMSAPPPGMGQTASQSGGYAQQSGGYAQQSGGYAQQSGGYAQQSGGYAQQSGPASVSVPGVAMPAHFMVPSAPASDGRMDPPGTSVTQRTRVSGRPATSWAMAVMAFGLFVGVGALAAMRGNAAGFMETSASFVDPARAQVSPSKAAGAPAAPIAAGVVPVAPGAVPAVAAQPAVAAVAAPVVGAPVVAAPVVAQAAPPPVVAAPVVAQPAPPPVATAPVVAAAPPAPKPAPHAWRPAPRPAQADEPVAAAPAPKPARVKPTPGAKPAPGDPAVDEEQKKALKQLQDAQLETPF